MRFKNIILQFLILFSFFFISLQIWLDRFFGVVDFEQLIIFLSFGATGLLDSDDYIINKFIQICIFLPIFLTFIFNLLFKYFFLWKSNNIKKIFITLKKFKFYFSLFFLAVSILFFLKSISFEDFLLRNNKIDFIKNYYIQPNLEDFKNKKENKNLVLIYVESLDDILLNEKLLPKETFDKYSLKDFRAKSVKKFIPTKYTNWTIGSIVATQCGIPQKPIGILDIENNKLNRNKLDKFGFGMKNFLPNAICIGDLLKKANYKNIFINAVNLKFANTGLFFKEHGYEEIIGKTYFDNLNLKHESFTWGGGPNDRVLFKLAKTKIKDLVSSNQKFNITILTTDTHDPGFIDDDCTHDENENFSNIMNAVICTSDVLYDFINFIYDNYYENTSIVILGDHIYPGKLSLSTSDKNAERSIYNSLISKDIKIYRDLINHYDFFPTILNLLNFSFNQDKLGLGVSFIKNTNIDNYNLYYDNLVNNIQNKSDFYVKFWK